MMKDYNILRRISEDIGICEARNLYKDKYWRAIIQKEYGITDDNFLDFKLGDHILVDGIEGIIVSCYNTGDNSRIPKWIMQAEKSYKGTLTWNLAMTLKLPEGWIIPSYTEFDSIGDNLKNLHFSTNSDFSTISLGGDYLWCSSVFDNGDASYFNIRDGRTWRSNKAKPLYLRAFKKLEKI